MTNEQLECIQHNTVDFIGGDELLKRTASG